MFVEVKVILLAGILIAATLGMPIAFSNQDLQRVIQARNALTPVIIIETAKERTPKVKDNHQLYSLLVNYLMDNQERTRRSSAAMFNEEQSEMLQGLANHLSARVRPG